MNAPRPSRREVIAMIGASAFASMGVARIGRAASSGGAIAMHLPWPVTSIDPHRTDDVVAGILGASLFDSAYVAVDGGVAPVLADSEPEVVGGGLRIAIRTGLRTARDRRIDARDVAWSIARARGLGAHGWLAPIPTPKLDGHDALVFAMRDAELLVSALASPLVAIVPRGFDPARPDGTGSLAADVNGGALVLSRAASARGGSLVDDVTVRASADLAGSLRAFETGEDAIGWLGSGLHEPRRGARPFDFGAVGWALLRTGSDAKTWSAPGVAQRLADGIPYARLAYLQIGAPWSALSEAGWGGPPCDLVVRDDAPWLVEIARAVAATLTRAGHEVTARPIAFSDFAQRRSTRSFALMIDVARPLAPSPLGALIGLATADDPTTAADLAKHPPRAIDPSPRALTRAMRVGVLGEVRVQGARAPDLSLAPALTEGIDFGTAARLSTDEAR